MVLALGKIKPRRNDCLHNAFLSHIAVISIVSVIFCALLFAVLKPSIESEGGYWVCIHTCHIIMQSIDKEQYM